MINALDHLIIAVSDLDLAEENYTKIFGLTLVSLILEMKLEWLGVIILIEYREN